MPRCKSIPAELPEAEILDIHALCDSIESKEIDLVCVLGPTASGKTRFAVRLATQVEKLSVRKCEIISADSRQVYRGMDIGTGKDLTEYGDVPYHLIDIRPAGDQYNVHDFQEDFKKACAGIAARGNFPILCGGTGLYINAVTRDYSFSEKIPLSLERESNASLKTFFIGTLVDRETRNSRIDARLDSRLEEGMIREVQGLLDSGVPAETLISYGLEYKFVTLHIKGELSYAQMREKLAIAIHQFAKRQMTWFRGMERSGALIHWVKV